MGPSVRSRRSREDPAEGVDAIGSLQWGVTDLAGGCLTTTASIVFSCGLLVVNGALVMATLATLSAAGAVWVQSQPLAQFILFSAPVGLLITQWMMLDYVLTVFRRR